MEKKNLYAIPGIVLTNFEVNCEKINIKSRNRKKKKFQKTDAFLNPHVEELIKQHTDVE